MLRMDPSVLTNERVVIAGEDLSDGVGFEVARFAACAGAHVYLLTHRERGIAVETRLREICDLVRPMSRGQHHVHHVAMDLQNQEDIIRAVRELRRCCPAPDVLVCCPIDWTTVDAAAPADGGEHSSVIQVLQGRYLLTKLCMEGLRSAVAPRIVYIVSSELYLTKFPPSELSRPAHGQDLSARRILAAAQRGQLLVAQRLAQMDKGVCVVCANPGWVEGRGGAEIVAAFEAEALGPDESELRTPRQAADGVCWLMAAPHALRTSGRLYLDRKVQKEHLAGAFFSQGWATKNSAAEVDQLIAALDRSIADSEQQAAGDGVTGKPHCNQGDAHEATMRQLRYAEGVDRKGIVNEVGAAGGVRQNVPGSSPVLGVRLHSHLWLRQRIDQVVCCMR